MRRISAQTLRRYQQLLFSVTTPGVETPFVVPAGVYFLDRAWGNGGGGGARGGTSLGDSAGGAGAGAYSEYISLAVIPGETLLFYAGNGGSGAPFNSNTATDGEASYIKRQSNGAIIWKADLGLRSTARTGALGGRAANCIGTTTIDGGNGQDYSTSSRGGNGGDSPNGGTGGLGGNQPPNSTNAGQPGNAPGGGGGGGRNLTGGSGGAGARGEVNATYSVAT